MHGWWMRLYMTWRLWGYRTDNGRFFADLLMSWGYPYKYSLTLRDAWIVASLFMEKSR